MMMKAVINSVKKTRPDFRKGDWFCTCGNHNFKIRHECNACGQAKPLDANDGPFSILSDGDILDDIGEPNLASLGITPTSLTSSGALPQPTVGADLALGSIVVQKVCRHCWSSEPRYFAPLSL